MAMVGTDELDARTEAESELPQKQTRRIISPFSAGPETFDEFVYRLWGRDNPRAKRLLDRCLFIATEDAIARENAILADRQALAERNRLARFRTVLADSQLRYKTADFDTNDLGEPFRVYTAFERSGKKYAGNARAVEATKVFAEAFQPGAAGLVLYGDGSGTGKTYLICAACVAIMQRGYSVLFHRFDALLSRIRDSYDVSYSADDPARQTTRGLMLSLLQPDVLVIDDLGAEKIGVGDAGDWVREQLVALVDRRVEAGKTLCATTNLGPEELLNRYDRRAMSRLFDRRRMAAVLVEAPDYRMVDVG
jgi:DNA replication protein DnaC